MLHKIHLLSEIKRFLLRWLTAHKYLSSAKILYNYRQNMSIYKLFTGTSSGCAFLLLLMFQRVDRCLLYSTKADSGDHIGSPLRMSVSKYGFLSAPTKRQRSAFCGKEETPAPKAKVFHRKTEQLHRAPTMSAAIGIMFFHSVHLRIGSRRSLVYWMKHHVSGRPHRVARQWEIFRILKFIFMRTHIHRVCFFIVSDVPVNFTGRSRIPPLRNPRQLVEDFFSRYIRALSQGSALRTGSSVTLALDETSRFRATT